MTVFAEVINEVTGQEPREVVLRIPRPSTAQSVSTVVAIFLIRPWVVMLALGAVHNDVWNRVPALGFWQTWISLVLIGLLRGGRSLNFPSQMWLPYKKETSK